MAIFDIWKSCIFHSRNGSGSGRLASAVQSVVSHYHAHSYGEVEDRRPLSICIRNLPARSTGMVVHPFLNFVLVMWWFSNGCDAWKSGSERKFENHWLGRIWGIIFMATFLLTYRWEFEGWLVSWVQEIWKGYGREDTWEGKWPLCCCLLPKVSPFTDVLLTYGSLWFELL